MAGLQPVSAAKSNGNALSMNLTTSLIGNFSAFPFHSLVSQHPPLSQLFLYISVNQNHREDMISEFKFWLRFQEKQKKKQNKQGKPPTLCFIQAWFQLPHEPQTFSFFACNLLHSPFSTQKVSSSQPVALWAYVSWVIQGQLHGLSYVTQLTGRNNEPAGAQWPWDAGTVPLSLGSHWHLPGAH